MVLEWILGLKRLAYSRIDLSLCCSVMHLSILCPTTPHTGIGGARWGFVTVMVTNPPPLGDDIL